MIYHQTVIVIPHEHDGNSDNLASAKAACHDTVPDTLGEGVKAEGEDGASQLFDLPIQDELFDDLLDRLDDFGALYYVRRNPRRDDDGEPTDPVAESLTDAARKEDLEIKRDDE